MLLIVRDPRIAPQKRGLTTDDFTLNVDLAPTILAAAGIAALPSMQGRDIAPLYLAAEKPQWRNDFFYEHTTINNKDFIPPSQALVTKEWKYLWKYFLWPEFGQEQLFHVSVDPLEESDLIGDPAQTERLAAMRKRFNELKATAP